LTEAISNTSPLLYLHRIGALDWLPRLFDRVLVPGAVVEELEAGQRRGYDAPGARCLEWAQVVEPRCTPSEWLASDLGAGELAVLALALENPTYTVLLDDALARRTAHAAGLTVMGTLGILLEAKSRGLIPSVAPWLDRLESAGMWLSLSLRQRILRLAGE